MNFNITRRQFLQYCTASAAALGLSQTDLLKLEKAFAATTSCSSPSPSVIYLAGQNCTGCQTSLLNRVVEVTGGYYDGDVLNALFGGTTLGTPNSLGWPDNSPPTTPIPELDVVNDVADLVVGDAVGALTIGERGHWAPFGIGTATGYITLEFLTTLMASAGDLPVHHLDSIVNAGGFVLLVDGAIPTGTSQKIAWPSNPSTHSINNEHYCYQLDSPGGLTSPGAPPAGPVTIADCVRWIAPQAAAIITVGTCSSFGGIPAANRNRTGAMALDTFLAQENISKPLIKVPGCPPHPDWIVYPVAYYLLATYYPGSYPGGVVCPLDTKGRPQATYGDTPQCINCPNQPTQGQPTAAQFLGDSGCLARFGCKGAYTFSDCPIRQKNTFDDGTKSNWCVGAQGPGAPSGNVGTGIGSAQHPCQGCIEPDFPDGKSPFYRPLPEFEE